MGQQNRIDVNTNPFILSGTSLVRENETIKQDAARVTDLEPYTIMGRIVGEDKWIAFDDETAEDGSAWELGIYLGGKIAAADIVAGDVDGAPILAGGDCTVDTEQLVIENGKTLDTVIKASANTPVVTTVRGRLSDIGIFTESTVDTAGFENQ